MEASQKRIDTRQRKKAHIRKRIVGTSERPRVSVFRSAKHIYAQAVDDESGKTLAQSSTLAADVKSKLTGASGNKAAANLVGKAFGEVLKSKGFTSIVFDRNGYLYHGRVKDLADGIREAGIEF
ncbi:MAG: 50S ribosomal protein L18 [Candidatus Lambdaproteobacteria bacterium RIFOXYD1_FULL_56_27]|uniref:Large ribosomal subunit protein uL18 n=1 Tax=Candidatus Lambdaproteobacteria bacterium RIFOXYD2_FULL_56_26 TaxID=1817773 RepID=A0A1F6GMP1_9PROT|nr:MAG: 50S ribosomal protein L18 [Candidatus Lambdaproteobacteria bacterium RIFOXYD2_FULL_56_26]OGH05629.1 MAG: 50S ribosomal protein L18 [Candidatus Lambdaproteobacteria bacterium RIFOXYC1_FULL_56_13]OGH08589.1 MAG: 50S ribosomal protein L18 [Candidatus Lambdaproteobacteria bacterium RIFOXYD1_FULL_56_27]